MPFIKGKSGNPSGRPFGSKNKETLVREERRRVFEQYASERWLDIIEKLPPVYIADQFLGKAPDKLELKEVEDEHEDLTPEVIELAKEELKRRKLGEGSTKE